MSLMVQTGEGTDDCLKHGFLPMPVHFYSPIPDIQDLKERKIWDRVSELKGINFRVKEQLDYLKKLGESYGHECLWPQNKTPHPFEYYTHNGNFSYGCAAALHTIIRMNKPKHIVEVGSGHSSWVISAALQKNKLDDSAYECQYLVIDPYPSIEGLPGLSQLIKSRVELVSESVFSILEENDILFIDSGHTVRIGGDVNFLYLDIIPSLKPGVYIHAHDINLPYEYPEVYYTNPVFRVFWTEAYLLQAFLAFNHDFEVVLAMNYIQTNYMDKFCEAFPHFDLKVLG
jgi:hypothetical protein